MLKTIRRITPFVLIVFIFSIIGLDLITASQADARSRFGGRSFSSSRTYKAPSKTPTTTNRQPSSFKRGLAGGLLGGAVGGLLFGSMFGGGHNGGIGGSGLGLLQILIFAGLGYFIFKKITGRKSSSYSQFNSHGSPHSNGSPNFTAVPKPPAPPMGSDKDNLAAGIQQIRQTDPDFDPDHFKEIAQDVFFQVQAGWMRRDLSTFSHLLGSQLTNEYEQHFALMKEDGHINKLENIAVRKVEFVEAGVDGNEDFATVLFVANLLDYTVDEKSGDIVDGSMTEPVKFEEKWTWARPVGQQNWLLERIYVVRG